MRRGHKGGRKISKIGKVPPPAAPASPIVHARRTIPTQAATTPKPAAAAPKPAVTGPAAVVAGPGGANDAPTPAAQSFVSEAVRMFIAPPERVAPDGQGPATAHGYLKKLSRETVASPPARNPAATGLSLSGDLLDAVAKRLPDGSVSPAQVISALESVMGSPARPAQMIDAMISMSARKGETIAGTIVIDREMADHLLTRNDANRTVGAAKLQQYIDDMTGGIWNENGGGVTISICGFLNDGQHRMHAISRTGTTHRMNITVGVTRESRRTVDTGKPRTTADHLRQDGYANSNVAAAIARAVMAYDHSNGSSMGRPSDISPTAVQDRVKDDAGLRETAQWSRDKQRLISGHMTGTIAGLMHYLLSRIDPEDAAVYLDGVLTGTEDGRGLDIDDPRWVVRERLRREAAASNHPNRVEILFRGWNAHRAGQRIKAVKINGTLPPLATAPRG